MKLVISEYGALIIAAITGALVLSAVIFFVFGNGKGTREYAESLERSVDTGEKKDRSSNQAMRNAVDRKLPEIRTEPNLSAGTVYTPEQLVHLRNPGTGQGKHELRILKVWNFQGTDCSKQMIRRDGSLTFPEEGVYRMKLFMRDEKGASGTMEVYLGVGL